MTHTTSGTVGTAFLLAAMLLLAGMLGGCQSGAGGAERFVYVLLTTGPESGKKTPEERQAIFAGHMANMGRLADAGQLIIAGPFDKPTDATWRGMFVFDVRTLNEAQDLVATDPGVQAGVFTPVLREMWASTAIRENLRLDRELQQQVDPTKAQKPGEGEGEGGEPPPNIRGYVMVNAEDGLRAWRGLEEAGLAEQVLWAGAFVDGDEEEGGVFVLDATSADEVRKQIESGSGGAGADVGPCAIDGWWSTRAVGMLPREAGRLREFVGR